jgi:heme/copper-type cytochrome/quinol oxidase subunit 2
MHKLVSMYLFLFITLYRFRARRAHHQERQNVSIQPLVTVILCWWPRCVQVGVCYISWRYDIHHKILKMVQLRQDDHLQCLSTFFLSK